LFGSSNQGGYTGIVLVGSEGTADIVVLCKPGYEHPAISKEARPILKFMELIRS
tara:strand:+ start:138 stop:299 length:162 start_codon:yes stop_codon:yes gene_type:complete